MMRIGEVAKEGGISVQAVRYYERQGLVPLPARRPSGYRDYPPRVVRQVRAIKWAQSLGFSLNQIVDVIDIGESHLRGRRAALRILIAAKLRELDDTLRKLSSMRRALLKIAACRCDGDCPIVTKALSTPARAHTPQPPRRRR